MTLTRTIAILIASLVLGAGCAKTAETQDGAAAPVATINGTSIPREVWNLYLKVRFQGQEVDSLDEATRKEALEDLIRMYAGAAQANTDGLVSGESAARIELMRQSAMADLFSKKIVDGQEPTEEQLKAEYDKRVAEMPKDEFNARHILVEDEAQAKDLAAQLDKGASFEKLAKDHSKDGSAAEGGDLGWFVPEQMVKPFADALRQLEKGKYTASPVQSQFGWHIIKLVDTRASTPPPFESVKSQLGQMVRQSMVNERLDQLVNSAKIERTP